MAPRSGCGVCVGEGPRSFASLDTGLSGVIPSGSSDELDLRNGGLGLWVAYAATNMMGIWGMGTDLLLGLVVMPAALLPRIARNFTNEDLGGNDEL